MKRILLLFALHFFLFFSENIYCQTPRFDDYFTWGDRFGKDSNSDDFVSSAKDQQVQGPCAAFAATALLEAAIQIYFNTPQNFLLK